MSKFFFILYFQFNLFKKIIDLNFVENLEKFKSFSLKDNERVRTFCINSKIRPIPNSTAESTKKKKVNDKTLRLSKSKPTRKTAA
jgi:hypothetical protein